MSIVRIARDFTLALLTVVAAWGADTKSPVSHQREIGKPATKTTAAKAPLLSDSQLETAIRAKFAKSKIDADHFKVHVQGGVATIEGQTGVLQHKGVATRMAKSAGAVGVNNRVQASAEAKQKAAANLEKGRRRAQIKRSDARSGTPASRSAR